MALSDELMAYGKINAKLGMVDPRLQQMQGTNVGMPDSVIGAPKKMYTLPGKRLNVSGWTNAVTGDVAIPDTGNTPFANTVAHEGFHSRQVPDGMLPPPAADANIRAQLARNMQAIQPDADHTPPNAKWGLRPNSSAEEQIANIRGYEGALPAGTSITKSPIASQLFQPSFGNSPGGMLRSAAGGVYTSAADGDVTANDLKSYYFHNSSLPYQGMWEGQSASRSMAERLKQVVSHMLLHAGINTVNR